MTNPSTQTFREFEHAGWQNVAEPYHDFFGALTTQTMETLLDSLNLRRGMNVVDVATGPGYVAAELERRGTKVTGIDFSSVMIERAKKLHPNICFEEGDAESLSFADMTFDAMSMNFGMLHLDKPEKAAKEAFRVLRPGARFAFSVWRTPDEAKAFGIVLDAVQKFGDPKAPIPPGPPFFRFSQQADCEKLLGEAGFRSLAFRVVDMCWTLKTVEEFFSAFYTGTPRTGGLLRAQSAEQLDAIKTEIEKQLAPYVVNGSLKIPMASVVASGQR